MEGKVQKLQQQVRSLTATVDRKEQELVIAGGHVGALQAGVGATTKLALSKLQQKLESEQQKNTELEAELDSLLEHIQQALGKEGEKNAQLEKTVAEQSAELADASIQLALFDDIQHALLKEEVKRESLERVLEEATCRIEQFEAEAAAAVCRTNSEERGMLPTL